MADTFELKKGVESEYSRTFLQGMIDRMSVSFHKYGAVKDAVGAIDFIESIDRRVKKYLETGNTEWLMDAANYAMMEFMHPSHPDAHFRGTDSKESPGRARTDGREAGQKHNLDVEVR